VIDGAAMTAAKRDIDSALDAFEDSLRVVTVLTAGQRKAITRAAALLTKRCMEIQTTMDIRLVREAFTP
jgi:hypothetical protein